MKGSILVIALLMVGCGSDPNPTPWETVADGFQFPEGPAWNGSALYVSNCYGDWLAKIEHNRVDTVLTASQDPLTFSQTNGLTFYRDGSLYACDFGLGAVLNISPERGTSDIIASDFNRPNDLAFGPRGDLYVTDPKSYGATPADGRIYRIDVETRSKQLVADSLDFPNGIAVGPKGSTLYVCESAAHRILTFPIESDGSLGEPTEFARVPGGDPDGIAFDEEGNLWVAHFGGSAVLVFSADGERIHTLVTPGTKPSNLEFGGPDLKTLYLTEDETNAVYKSQVDIAGFKLYASPYE
jgi:gluconolactonase